MLCGGDSESLHTIQVKLCLLGRAMAQAVSRRPVTAQARVRSRGSPCETCGGHSVTGSGFSPSISVLSCHYHSTDAVYSSSSACYSYQKDKRAKLGEPYKKQCKFENRRALGRKVLSLSLSNVLSYLNHIIGCMKYGESSRIFFICLLVAGMHFFLIRRNI